MKQSALKYALPPGAPKRQNAYGLARTAEEAGGEPGRLSGLTSDDLLVDCGCPLAAEPHTRDAHALACLQRDLPELFPRAAAAR